MPTVTAPSSTDGSPRGMRANRDPPASVAIVAACRSTGRRKSTATWPSLTRRARSVRPVRLTEPSSPWDSQMYVLIDAVSYPCSWPPAARTVANRIATLSSPKVRLATRPPTAASRYADWRRKPATRSRQYTRAVARIETHTLLARPANPERILAGLRQADAYSITGRLNRLSSTGVMRRSAFKEGRYPLAEVM